MTRKNNNNGKPNGKINSLKQRIVEKEAFAASLALHIKAYEKLIRQHRTGKVKRITDSELHALHIQIADLKALQTAVATQIDMEKTYLRYLEGRNHGGEKAA